MVEYVDLKVMYKEGEAFRSFPNKEIVIVDIKNNHIPEAVYNLTHSQDVFYVDNTANKLVQIIDLRVSRQDTAMVSNLPNNKFENIIYALVLIGLIMALSAWAFIY